MRSKVSPSFCKKVAFFLCCILFGPSLAAQDERTLIRDVDLFDGHELRKEVDIALQNGTIERIAKELEAQEGSDVIEGKGKGIIPPLINAHVHAWDPKVLERGLGHGIFAFLDLHNGKEGVELMREFNDSLEYSRFYSSHAGATVPGGHGTQFGLDVPVLTEDYGAKEFVKDRVEEGADYIKILREPMRKTIDFDQTRKVIEAAHEHDKLVIAHISRLSDAMTLARQGVDGFAHIWVDEKIREKQLDSLQDAGVFMIPTLAVQKKFIEKWEEEKDASKILSYEELEKELKKLHDAGIPILAGNDAPNFSLSYSEGLYEEMNLLEGCGLSRKEVYRAATTKIYEAFGLDRYDKVHEGGRANFLLIEESPLEGKLSSDRVHRIFKKGNELDPDRLLKTSEPPEPEVHREEKADKEEAKGEGELTLTVRIQEIRSSEGEVLLELKNEKDEVIRRERAGIEEGEARFEMSGLKEGSYAARVLHDENGNKKFDTNNAGMPQEGWGYSNNAKGNMGPPPLEEQLFRLKADKSISIRMRYMGN